MFIVLVQTQQTGVQRLSPENKGVSPYRPSQAGYRSKKQSATHMWLHVTSLAISFPQCYVTFMLEFFKFYLSALPPPSPVRTSACLFLFWPPLSCYTIPPLMFSHIQGQRASP
jgi:hypothetical protein